MRYVILSILFLGTVVAACTTTKQPPPSSGSLWDEPAAYSYSVSSSCGERAFIGTFSIEVAQGEVVNAEALDRSAESAIARFGVEALPTLGDLVAEYEAGEADVSTIEFSPDHSHPISIAIDYDTDAMDDEACYTVTNFSDNS